MKSIQVKILVTIFVITVALCSSITRENTKAKTATKSATKTKSIGSGTWNDGYVCQKITITDLATKQTVDTVEFEFKPADLSTMDDGLVIKMANGAKPAILNEILVSNTEFGKTYIPWRYITTDKIEYTKKSWNSSKRITFDVRSDNQKRYEVALVMPYATVGNFITKEQCETLIGAMGKHRDDSRNAVISFKKDVLTSVTKLKTELYNKSMLTQQDAKIKADALKKIQEVKAALPALSTSEDAVQKQIDAKRLELSPLNIQKIAITEEISKLSNEIDSDTNLITNDTVRKAAIQSAGTEISNQNKNIQTEVEKIKAIAVDAKSKDNADAAGKMAKEYKLNEMNAYLNKIYSVNTQ